MKTVDDILNLEPGEIVTEVQGKLLNIKDRKSGTNAKGAWSVQQGELMDATGKVKLKVWNHPDIAPMNGREVTIKAHHNDKHGWSGAIAADDTYQDIVTRELKITATGLILPVNGQQPQPATPTPSGHQNPVQDPVEACKGHLGRAGVAMVMCLKTALEVATMWEAVSKTPLTPEQFQAITSSFFIDLGRTGLIQSLPSAPTEEKEVPF
jgi:hypothetical protein